MNHTFKTLLLILTVAVISCNRNTPIETSSESAELTTIDSLHHAVYAELLVRDSILFDHCFNRMDTSTLRTLIRDDFEFYHDQSGITDSKDAFIQTMGGLAQLDYHATRELDSGSVEVHLLRNNGTLYGAIQTGKHSFYAESVNSKKHLTSTADFTHLWRLHNGQWMLSRVMSFNHQSP